MSWFCWPRGWIFDLPWIVLIYQISSVRCEHSIPCQFLYTLTDISVRLIVSAESSAVPNDIPQGEVLSPLFVISITVMAWISLWDVLMTSQSQFQFHSRVSEGSQNRFIDWGEFSLSMKRTQTRIWESVLPVRTKFPLLPFQNYVLRVFTITPALFPDLTSAYL